MAAKTAEMAGEKAKTGEKVGYQEEVVVRVPEMEVPVEFQEKAQSVIDAYTGFLRERTEAYTLQAGEAGVTPEAGEPIYPAGYQYWNCLTYGPIQFIGDPPFRPSKVIAAGEWALMLGVVWINPVPPAKWVFAGKQYQVRFETIDLSNVINGPGAFFGGVFPPPAALSTINVFPWWFMPGDPGPSPNLYETTLTADLTMAGMPFAAFSTWHRDPEGEPGMPPFTPPIGPRWQHDVPARFLVYRK